MRERSRQEKILVYLFWVGGAVLVTAFPMMLLPVSWMAATHEWLGLGEFPESLLVDYLTRSISALYGFHGVLLFVLARDVVRFRPVVVFVAVMGVVFGVMMTAVDLHAGVPWHWTLCEGPVIAVFGLVVLYLLRSIPRT
jgi:hypothetical protein